MKQMKQMERHQKQNHIRHIKLSIKRNMEKFVWPIDHFTMKV